MARLSGFVTVAVVGIAVATMVWMHRALGGDLRVFVQPEAIAVVLGGTIAALLVSFPGRARRGALFAVVHLARRPVRSVEALVPVFISLANTARRQGWAAVEGEIDRLEDPFVARAIGLSASGLAPDVVRETLEVEARVSAERDEEHALVFDAAARYAPTLGILGGLLGLMRVVEQASWPAAVGPGLASALVATVYGVAATSLVFQPIATRLRARARANARRRALTIHGVVALRDGAAPSVVQERLAGYLQRERAPLARVA